MSADNKTTRGDSDPAAPPTPSQKPMGAGPRPVLEALQEVEAGRPLGAVLERYARIPAHIYRALGADALRPQIHRIKISLNVTSDSPDGQPWPPSEGNALWVMVRRADGCTLWRAIELAQVRPAATDFENP